MTRQTAKQVILTSLVEAQTKKRTYIMEALGKISPHLNATQRGIIANNLMNPFICRDKN